MNNALHLCRATLLGSALIVIVGFGLKTATAQTCSGDDAATASFRQCLGSSGESYGSTCQLDPGVHQISCTLVIARNDISSITGTEAAGPADTVLQRASSSLDTILQDSRTAGAVALTVSYLTFDGNRYGSGLGLNCLPIDYPNPLQDVDFRGAPNSVSLQYDDFINAPDQELLLAGTDSTVVWSNFSQGFGSESAAQTATRRTAVWLYGNSTGAYFNNIAFAGNAGVHLDASGTQQYIYGNLLQQNRYEMPDGIEGGQIYIDESATYASVAGNVINGNYWYTEPGGTIPGTGCPVPSSEDSLQTPGGTETYGYGHRFYNNEIEQHTGWGMGFSGSAPTGSITISSTNPWDSSDAPRYIEDNLAGGIMFLGQSGGPDYGAQPYGTTDVTLDDVLVQNNGASGWGANGGIWLDTVTGPGFTCSMCSGGSPASAACMSGNYTSDIINDSGSSSLSTPFPATLSYYWNGVSGACPASGSQTPAP